MMGKVLEAAGLPNEYNTATFVQYMPIIGPVGCSGYQFKDGVCCVTSCTALKYYTSTTGVVVAIVRRTPSNCDAADESDSTLPRNVCIASSRLTHLCSNFVLTSRHLLPCCLQGSIFDDFFQDPEIQRILHVRGHNLPGLNVDPEEAIQQDPDAATVRVSDLQQQWRCVASH
jgi:hypothetical protein